MDANQDFDLKKHRLRMPLAIVMFGKPIEVTCEIQFLYCENNNFYDFKKCRGYFEGVLIDFGFLTHHSDFAKMVSGNKQDWDNDDEWWNSKTKEDPEPEPTDPWDGDFPSYA